MRTSLALALVLAAGAAYAGDIDPASACGYGDSVAGAPSDGQRGPILYDTLWFVDNHTYDAGNGNAYSGMGLFGFIYDLQLADDFTTTTGLHFISEVTADYLCFFGGTPANGLQVDVWTDTGAGPGSLVASQTVPVSWASSWSDPIFGLAGRRLGATVNIPLAPNTDYYIMIQPVDLTSSGDWYYQVRDLDSFIGGDSYGRDGGRGSGGYGTTAWTSMGDFGFGVGDVSMRLWVPAPSAAAILGLGALAPARRRH